MTGPPRPKRGYWIPAVIALTALVAIGAAFGAGDLVHSAPRTLSGSDVSSQIALAIQVSDRSSSPPEVECPKTEPVRSGWQFPCSVQQAGRRYSIEVIEVDGRGHLRWQPLPKPSGGTLAP